MPEASGILAKYVFLDVVDFSKVRSTAAQLNIISVLNTIVRQAVAAFDIPEGDSGNVIYLPTGDGICVAVIDANQLPEGHDIHLRLALRIIEDVQQHNDTPDLREEMKFQVRIGINDHSDDKRITDINNRPNLAGAGINMAQRIMSFAEGNQIFVGSNTYDVLKNYYKYMAQGMFRHYDLTVKHADAPGRVFQYIGETGRHRGLNIMPPEASLMKEEAITLYKSASDCGMKKIYHSRAEVADSVLRDIEGARRRVWISAVGLAEKVKLSDILSSIDKNPLRSGLEVKFLLLDALRSTALFRTFLEISREAFHDIISLDRGKRPPEEPYFLQTLYNTFQTGYAELRRRNAPNFSARFYGHTPTCWLVIVDDTAYFQPYTFGKGKSQTINDLTLGPLMPVFKFQLQDQANTETFNILEDHFKKLWLTSDIDLFHLGARLAQKHELLNSIFLKRRKWFRYIYNVLHEDDKKATADDRRWRTRRSCESAQPPQTKVSWTPPEGGETIQAEAEIINFSHEGILLRLMSVSLPTIESIATLKVTTANMHPPTDHLMNELLKPSNHRFRVVRVTDRLVALTSRPKKDAPPGTGLAAGSA